MLKIVSCVFASGLCLAGCGQQKAVLAGSFLNSTDAVFCIRNSDLFGDLSDSVSVNTNGVPVNRSKAKKLSSNIPSKEQRQSFTFVYPDDELSVHYTIPVNLLESFGASSKYQAKVVIPYIDCSLLINDPNLIPPFDDLQEEFTSIESENETMEIYRNIYSLWMEKGGAMIIEINSIP